MLNNYDLLIRDLAKQTRAQNLFYAAKDISGINIFNNISNFTKIQQLYLNYLYFYDTISSDIITEHISKKVFNNHIFEDAYMYWKRNHKETKKDNKTSDVKLVPARHIKFPKR